MKRSLFFVMNFIFLNTISAQWTNGTNLPEGIRAGNTESFSQSGTDFIYLIGGRNDQEIISNKTYRYNLSTNIWETKSNVPTPILGASSARIGNNIYIIGGMVTTPGTVTKKVYKYDINLDIWDTVADTPIAYTDGDAVAYQDSLIYTVGSYSHERSFVYNVNTNKWREGTALPSPGTRLSYGALSVYGNKLVYVGGSNGTFAPLFWNNVWIGEIDQNNRSVINWSQGTPFPGETRTFFELKPWNNGLILIGGTTDNTFDTVSNENYFYDLQLNTWSALTPKPTAWNTGNATSIFTNNIWKLFCTGGFNTVYLKNTEIYTQENLSTSDANSCTIKNMKIIDGKQHKLSFCTKENGRIGLKILDIQGRIIKEKSQIANRAGNHEIPLSDLQLLNGVYFVMLDQNGVGISKKMRIEK